MWVFWGTVTVLFILLGVWLLYSFRILGPDEMGAWLKIGRPVRFVDSGLTFAPWPFYYLRRLPKKQFILDFEVSEVISGRGEYEGRLYSAVPLKVDGALYLVLPPGEPLFKALERKFPTDEKEIMALLQPEITGALLTVIGPKTWREVVDKQDEVEDLVEEVIERPESSLARAGFGKEQVHLVIKKVALPEPLARLLPSPEEEELKKEAAKAVAGQRATETVGAVLEAMAQSRGVNMEGVRQLISDSPELQQEFLTMAKDYVARRMALDGNSFVDIRVEGAEGFEKTLLNLLAAWQRMPKGGVEKGEEKTPPVGVIREEDVRKYYPKA